tara:strand:+ start:7405 stop:7908 length:504 start_codon:yes stop_codon:yes gene_type:complete
MIRLNLAIIFFICFSCCTNNNAITEDELTWRDEYGILPGTSAIAGQITGNISNRMSFQLELLGNKKINYLIRLNNEQKFLVINLDPGNYRLVQKNILTLTLLDSIPVVAEFITVLRMLSTVPDSLATWNPPPPTLIVRPTEIESSLSNRDNFWQILLLEEDHFLNYR